MIRNLVWLAGSVALCVLSWKFASWRLMAQLSLLGVTFLWVFIGGFLAAASGRLSPGKAARAPLGEKEKQP